MSAFLERLPIGPTLRQTRVVAILRAATGDHLRAVANTLVESGVRCLEITTTTPGCWEATARLRAEHDYDVEVGVGTVRAPEQVDAAAEHGASFIVAPNFDPAVGRRATERGLGWYPGALTPTEITKAWEAGATAVKVFPAASVGGPSYLRHVRAPLPDVPLLPTGGVNVAQARDYLAAGAVAVGLGSPLIGDALATGDVAPLAARARELMAALAVGQ